VPRGARGPRPAEAVELSDRNWLAWQHYRECRAIGRFPDDPIVRRNAAIIRDVEDEFARGEYAGKIDLLLAMILKGSGR
jgi:hypothetical protein